MIRLCWSRATVRRRLVLLVLLPVALGVAHAAPVRARSLTIAEARQAPLGSVVTVEGAISTPSGAFASSFFDAGFGLQDRTAGIYVSVPTNLGVGPGQAARVTGKLQNNAGLLVIVPAQAATVHLLGAAPLVQPTWVATGAVGQANQGLIVGVRGRITEAAALDQDPTTGYVYGFTFAVNNGSGPIRIFVNTQTGISMRGLTKGKSVQVIGFSSAYDFSSPPPEIDPRSPADVTILTGD